MSVCRVFAVAAVPCLCLAAEAAEAQSRRAAGPIQPIAYQLPAAPASNAGDQRVAAPVPLPDGRVPGMIESWDVGGNAAFGLGRYSVGTVPRPRSNMERERMMERENRAIAGAGVQLRF